MPFFRQLTFKNCGVSVVTLLLFILTSCSGGEGGTNGGNNAGPGITTITASENCVGSTSARWSLRECGSRAYLGGVAWSGSLYVAVGWSYTDVGSDVLTSTDGITWTRRTTGKDSPYHLHRIAWGNGLFVAVGEQKEILTSTNGIVWQVRQSPVQTYFTKIIWTGTEFLAIGGQGVVIKSPDGMNWVSSPETLNASDVIWVNDRYLLLGNGFVYTSTDGLHWIVAASGLDTSLMSIAWSGNRFVAVGSAGKIFSSNDGTTWNDHSLPTPLGWSKVIWADNQFVAFGWRGTIHVSLDGTTWTERRINAPEIADVIRSGSSYVAVGEFGNIATSTDGVDWVARTIVPSLGAVVATNNGFLAVGGYGNVASSTDGKVWSRVPTNIVDHHLYDVVWSGSQFVGVGVFIWLNGDIPIAQSVIVTSPDGSTWTRRKEGNVGQFSAVAWSGNAYVASGDDGVFTSPDGIAWTLGASATQVGNSFTRIIWTGSQFVAVGGSSSIYTSPDGINWTKRTPDVSAAFFSVACSPSLCVTVGHEGGGGAWTVTCVSGDTVSWHCDSWVEGVFNTLDGVIWTGTEFVAVGLFVPTFAENATQDVILKSPDGITWTLDYLGNSFNNLRGIAVSGSQLVVVGGEGAIFSSP